MPQLLICMCCILNNFPNAYKAHICKGKYYRSIYRSNLIKGKNHSSVKIVGARKRWPTRNRNHSVFRSRSNNACSLYRIHSDTVISLVASWFYDARCRLARKQLFCTLPARSPSPKQKRQRVYFPQVLLFICIYVVFFI